MLKVSKGLQLTVLAVAASILGGCGNETTLQTKVSEPTPTPTITVAPKESGDYTEVACGENSISSKVANSAMAGDIFKANPKDLQPKGATVKTNGTNLAVGSTSINSEGLNTYRKQALQPKITYSVEGKRVYPVDIGTLVEARANIPKMTLSFKNLCQADVADREISELSDVPSTTHIILSSDDKFIYSVEGTLVVDYPTKEATLVIESDQGVVKFPSKVLKDTSLTPINSEKKDWKLVKENGVFQLADANGNFVKLNGVYFEITGASF
jgi:hypothetical protein